jgi:signal transduction histidine kinase
VLDLSKIEAGKMELFIETVDAAMLIRETVEGCRNLAANNGNVISFQAEDALGTITCDRRKLQQALTQILDNAAKFTENGAIAVTASRRAAASGEEIVVAVRDTGIGIAAEILPALFEKFSVADDSTSSKYGGTGLGLALSQRLCRLMGGDISVDSKVGAGSCFTIHLPTNALALAGSAEADAVHAGFADDATRALAHAA